MSPGGREVAPSGSERGDAGPGLLTQSSTPTPWSFNQLLVLFGSVGRCQILLENEISIFKKLVSRRKQEVQQNVYVKQVQ